MESPEESFRWKVVAFPPFMISMLPVRLLVAGLLSAVPPGIARVATAYCPAEPAPPVEKFTFTGLFAALTVVSEVNALGAMVVGVAVTVKAPPALEPSFNCRLVSWPALL